MKKKKKKKENKKEDKKEKDDLIKVFVILIELTGKIKEFRCKISIRNGKYYVNITGIKELPKVREMQYNNIDENEFRIEFELNNDEIELKSNKLKKSIMNNGIIKLYYEIKNNEEEIYEIKINKK